MSKHADSALDRRQALRLLGGGIAAVTVAGLAGCGGEEAPPAAPAGPAEKPAEPTSDAAEAAAKETAQAAPDNTPAEPPADTVAQTAPAAEPTRVAEDEAQAQALGYRHDAGAVDSAKFAAYAPGQACANCTLYAGEGSDGWGPCPIFGNRLVNAKGWCSAYVAKA